MAPTVPQGMGPKNRRRGPSSLRLVPAPGLPGAVRPGLIVRQASHVQRTWVTVPPVQAAAGAVAGTVLAAAAAAVAARLAVVVTVAVAGAAGGNAPLLLRTPTLKQTSIP